MKKTAREKLEFENKRSQMALLAGKGEGGRLSEDLQINLST